MSFQLERDMAGSVRRWLLSLGLTVKAEVPTPWGIVDFVGCSIDHGRAQIRLGWGQKKTIGSALHVALLQEIPDLDAGRPITLRELQAKYADLVPRKTIATAVARLSGARFIRANDDGVLAKLNGWMPLHRQLISVELKLSRVTDAVNQAVGNLGITDESYVALPAPRAGRLMKSRKTRDFATTGIGLLAVFPTTCHVLIPAGNTDMRINPVAQAHCVEQFWRVYMRTKGSSA